MHSIMIYMSNLKSNNGLVYAKRAFFKNIFFGSPDTFFYELHYHTSCRFDDCSNQKILLQTDRLDFLPVIRFYENTP